jgi:(R,R)-butanediol dehydrogenase/meso-butanediol dehydrogenase/diacetyl reductase
LKALQYLEPHLVKTVNMDVPACNQGEALIRVHWAGICGTDLHIFHGRHPRAKAPLVMGHEFSGEVVEIKPGTAKTDLAAGDQVTAYPLLMCGECWPCRNGFPHVCRNLKLIGIDRDGAFAQYVSVPLDLVFKLPTALSSEQGALVEPLAVGIHALSMAGEPHWQTAVVIGCGPIGLIVALCLRHAGVENILSSDINPHRVKRAENLDFHVINSAKIDLARSVEQATDGEGADVVFECAGTEVTALQMGRLVRPRGTVVVVATHKDPHAVDLQTVTFRELSVIGTRVYTREDYRKALEWINTMPVDKLVSHRFQLEEASAGFEIMTKPEDVCKVLINME